MNKAQQRGQIVFQKTSITKQPAGKDAKVIPSNQYFPAPKKPSKMAIKKQIRKEKKLTQS